MILQLQQLSISPVLGQLNDLVRAVEEQNFFPLAYYKDQERIRKCEFFTKNGFNKIIVVTNSSNYGNVSSNIKQEKIETITDQQLSMLTSDSLDCRKKLEGAIVIMTNNNVAKIDYTRMASLIEAAPNTLFVIHDFDNHHWHDHSIKCALFADVYAPAHLSDFAIAGRINPVIVAGIPCGSIQWKKQFLSENFQKMLENKRRAEPLGMHSYYEKFKFRNSVIATVSKTFGEVGFLKKDFHGRSDMERWEEWINYPVHWIAPVFNDLPLRFFDSLITGGIPMVPSSLRPYLNMLGIPKDFYIYYTPSDLLAVDDFVGSSITEFDRLGEKACELRHNFILEAFHVDEIIYKLFSSAKNEYIGLKTN
jgi:hypothetical protein